MPAAIAGSFEKDLRGCIVCNIHASFDRKIYRFCPACGKPSCIMILSKREGAIPSLILFYKEDVSMKRIAISLLVAALAVSLTACGGPKLSDSDLMDIARQQVSYDRHGTEVTDVELVSSTAGEDDRSDVVITVTSETDYVIYEDQYTLTLQYDEDNKQWRNVSGDDVQRTTLRAEAKNIPDADTLADIIYQNQQDGYGLLEITEDDDSYSSRIMPFDYTVGEPVSGISDNGGVQLTVPLQVEGCRFGWLIFHGTMEAKLGIWPDTGKWQLRSVEPSDGFSVTSILDGRSYTSDVYDMTGSFQDYPRQYTDTIHFGNFDWATQTFPGTTITRTNLTENTEDTKEVECYVSENTLASESNLSVQVSTWSFGATLPQDDADPLDGYSSYLGDWHFTLDQ